MEKTRKAFVVLAAAVTAGNYIGCGSNDPAEQDAQLADAAAKADAQGADVVTKKDTQGADVVTKTDTQGADVVTKTDTQGADAADAIVLADAQGSEAATPMDTQGLDASPRTDAQVVADLRQESVIVNADASIPPPDTRPDLAMPAGTAYDVLVRNDVA